MVLVRSLLPALCAYTAFTRPQSPGGTAVSAEVEHRVVRLPAVLVPLYSHNDHHSRSGVAGDSRIRARPDWPRDYLERHPAHPGRVYRWASASPQIGSSHPVRG